MGSGRSGHNGKGRRNGPGIQVEGVGDALAGLPHYAYRVEIKGVRDALPAAMNEFRVEVKGTRDAFTGIGPRKTRRKGRRKPDKQQGCTRKGPVRISFCTMLWLHSTSFLGLHNASAAQVAHGRDLMRISILSMAHLPDLRLLFTMTAKCPPRQTRTSLTNFHADQYCVSRPPAVCESGPSVD